MRSTYFISVLYKNYLRPTAAGKILGVSLTGKIRLLAVLAVDEIAGKGNRCKTLSSVSVEEVFLTNFT